MSERIDIFDGFLNSAIEEAVDTVISKNKEFQELYGTKKQMRLSTFRKVFDVAKTSAARLVHRRDFPSYKIDGLWYVDVPEFYEWRKTHNLKEC